MIIDCAELDNDLLHVFSFQKGSVLYDPKSKLFGIVINIFSSKSKKLADSALVLWGDEDNFAYGYGFLDKLIPLNSLNYAIKDEKVLDKFTEIYEWMRQFPNLEYNKTERYLKCKEVIPHVFANIKNTLIKDGCVI